MGAILVDNLEIPSMNVINDAMQSGERALMLAEFKLSLNSYLSELATSPVRSLSDIIEFNKKHPVEVNIGHRKDFIFIHNYHAHLIFYVLSFNINIQLLYYWSQERMAEFGQDYLLQSEATNGIGPTEEHAILKLNKLYKRGLEKIMQDKPIGCNCSPRCICSQPACHWRLSGNNCSSWVCCKWRPFCHLLRRVERIGAEAY